LIRRFAWLPALLLAAVPALAAVETTTVQGKVLAPNGAAFTSGTITAVLSAAGTTDDAGTSQRVAMRETGSIDPNGTITGLVLVPNDVITPSSTYYTVTFSVKAPIYGSWTELWSVATAPDPIDVGDITRLDVGGTLIGMAIKEDATVKVTNPSALEFDGADFDVAASGSVGIVDLSDAYNGWFFDPNNPWLRLDVSSTSGLSPIGATPPPYHPTLSLRNSSTNASFASFAAFLLSSGNQTVIGGWYTDAYGQLHAASDPGVHFGSVTAHDVTFFSSFEPRFALDKAAAILKWRDDTSTPACAASDRWFGWTAGNAFRVCEEGVLSTIAGGGNPAQTKCINIDPAHTTTDWFFFRVETAITVTGIDCIVDAATSVVMTLRECDGNGGTCGATEAAITCAATNTTEAAGIDDAAVDAGDWLRVLRGTVSGSPTQATLCATYTVN